MSDAWRSVQRQQQEGEERRSHGLRERDAVVEQLQAALLARTQEAQVPKSSSLCHHEAQPWQNFFFSPQELRCSLLARVQLGPAEVLEELKVRLQLKDRLFQEVLSDRMRQTQEHQDQVQDLLRTISSRDQYIQVGPAQLGLLQAEAETP